MKHLARGINLPKLIVILGIGIGVSIAVANAFFFKKPQENTPVSPVTQGSFPFLREPQITPTPLPFAELTIPYLREREYESSLGKLEKVSENANYTSYTTSYDSDGFKVNGLLTIPKRATPKWPAIVFIHGYIPPSEYQTLTRYVDHVDYLARNGFVVFKIDLRGHGNSEGEAGGGYYSSDYVIDALNARAALQTSDFVKPDAIGLWGHSMSGNVVYRAFTAKPEIPAIVIWAGAVYTYQDMQDYSIDDNSYRPPPANSNRVKERQRLRETHGDFSPESDFWKQVAPTNYVGDLRGAIQINHARDDAVVSIEYSRNIMRLLDTTQIIHELKEYPSGGHNITGGSFTSAMQNTVSFFKEYLQ